LIANRHAKENERNEEAPGPRGLEAPVPMLPAPCLDPPAGEISDHSGINTKTGVSVRSLLTTSAREFFLIGGNRMGYTGRLASQSDLMFMTYKVVHIEGMDVEFCFHKKNIQICNGFVTDGRVQH
jgi:hypothetical protein